MKCRGAVVEWLPDGTPWRVLGTHTDITKISEAADAKVAFVSRMSHEIRYGYRVSSKDYSTPRKPKQTAHDFYASSK